MSLQIRWSSIDILERSGNHSILRLYLNRIVMLVVSIVYAAIVIILACALTQYPIFIALILLVIYLKLNEVQIHFILVLLIGRYAVKAVLFPYANKLVTTYLDG